MFKEEEDKPQSAPRLPPPVPAGAKIYSRSVSWAPGRSPANPTPGNPKSLWNNKNRGCLPPLQPLSVSRPKAEEWPRAGSDDLGVWPSLTATATTPGARPKPPTLHVDKSSSSKPREFEFKKDKLAFFDKECSRIIDHVFLGSDAVAKNRDVLRQNGITHVLNCVGFVCPEYFKTDLVYKTLWLQDSPSEDITSILYDVFDYFEDVRAQNGRVFVHCCQGVSRSTSLVIAYLMWREGYSFEDAFQEVKSARGVTNPNMGFASQLLQCQKRVHAVPVSPNSVLRMYRIAPHSSYAPLHLVPKLLAKPSEDVLDSRGAFIVNVPARVYVWIGKNCDPLMYDTAKLAASQVIRYEKANGPALIVKEGEEPVEFWESIGTDQEHKGVCVPGKRKVVDYDVDFGVFMKAANSGVVPPLYESEMCLPARRSGWERLRRKFTTGIMKELITSLPESDCDSPDSCSSFSEVSVSRSWIKAGNGNEDDSPESMSSSPNSFSSFLVKDPRKFDDNSNSNTASPLISPSTSDYSNSFSFSPTSSNWSDLSLSPSGLESINPKPEISPSLIRTWSFSMEDQTMEDSATNKGGVESEFLLYHWPSMEKVEMGRIGIPDSRGVYITYIPDVVYIWVGRHRDDDHDDDDNDDDQWQIVGNDFILRKSLERSSVVQIVREGEEPEQLWKHLHCFSFQNTEEEEKS